MKTKSKKASNILVIGDLHCIPVTSEVLTKTGWKNLTSVSVGEDILSYDKSNTLSYSPIKAIVPTRKEKVLTFKRGRVTFDMTMGHRNVIVNSNYSLSIRTTEELFKNKVVTLKATGVKHESSSSVQDDILLLIGFCLGDGTRDINNWKISVKKQRKIDLLSQERFSQYLTKNINGQRTVFRVKSEYTKVVDQFMGSKKQINWESFCALNVSQIEFLMHGIIASDGSRKKDRPNIGLSAIRKEHLHLVQTLQHLSGKLGVIGMTCSNINSTYPSDKPLYTMTLYSNQLGGFVGKFLEGYKETDVSCVTVESGMFLMRQGDCVTITGNCPYNHRDMVPFLTAIKEKYKPSQVVQIGDEVDFHDSSFHDSDPDLDSAGQELNKAIKALTPLYKLFPDVTVIDSNHGSMMLRKALPAKIPRKAIQPNQFILDAPKGWIWKDSLILKTRLGPVIFYHGKSSAPTKVAGLYGMSVVQGHYHETSQISYISTPERLIFGCHVGCIADDKSRALAYNKTNAKRPIISSMVIEDGVPHIIPMILNKRGRWIGEL